MKGCRSEVNIEEILNLIDFSKGLIPVIVQDCENNDVLMLAYTDREALKRTIETGSTWFWSRSRKEYWNKGKTSGHVQYVKSISVDCDGDTILMRVKQIGVACHTGNKSCFYRNLKMVEGKEKYR